MGRSSEVEILLATFNGDRFLREQIESILSQDYENLRILARDDGSTDRTVEILSEFAARFPSRFQILPTICPGGSAKDNFLHQITSRSAFPAHAITQSSLRAVLIYADGLVPIVSTLDTEF
jgi:glycosyltransferase involved in cell wall biosynthesis